MSDTLRPVSIYTLFAQLFSSVAREVTADFGAAGAAAVRRGVRKYGEARGRHIAQNAALDGRPNTIENYLPYYDMERSGLFVYATAMSDNLIDQEFYKCPFAEAWIKDGDQSLGKLYCDEIDRAIAAGFNPGLKHEEITHLLDGAPSCHMTFQMKKGDKNAK
ncbi:MAG: L-2-amino-thiazoline-4-carboxylic acid hydrolase [Acidaminococcales bacterium]|jgi:hypothetical protein|nr:L-2-amino-thiazoline-4-carboxylic acid hydrolase [Acidaminococcales bacterium]